MSDKSTTPPYSISEDTKVKLPLRSIGLLFGIVAAGALAWGLTTRTVADQGRRLDSVEREQRAMREDQRTTREVLIRIDERTAEIKRRMDAP